MFRKLHRYILLGVEVVVLSGER